jgi:hypothetical protein
MALPVIVEYLLSLERGDAAHGRLCFQGMQQLVVPVIPPNTQIVLTSATMGSDYAYIVYQASWDPDMVPGVFYVWAQNYGNRMYEGLVTAIWLQQAVDTYAVITQSQTGQMMINNISPLNQYYVGRTLFLTIKTPDDYAIVSEALKRASSEKLESLASSAVHLLSLMTKSPLPPAGGG